MQLAIDTAWLQSWQSQAIFRRSAPSMGVFYDRFALANLSRMRTVTRVWLFLSCIFLTDARNGSLRNECLQVGASLGHTQSTWRTRATPFTGPKVLSGILSCYIATLKRILSAKSIQVVCWEIGDHFWSSFWFSNKQHYLSLLRETRFKLGELYFQIIIVVLPPLIWPYPSFFLSFLGGKHLTYSVGRRER